jgi:hypothetical protein
VIRALFDRVARYIWWGRPRPFLARALDEAAILARAKQAPKRDLSAAEVLDIEVDAVIAAEILRQAKARTAAPVSLDDLRRRTTAALEATADLKRRYITPDDAGGHDPWGDR